MILVEAAENHHEVSLAGHLPGTVAQRVDGVLRDGVDTAVHRAPGGVALCELDLRAVEVFHGLERAYIVFHLELARAATFVETTHGVVADYENPVVAVSLDRKEALTFHGGIFHEHNGLVADFLGHGVVFGGSHRAKRFLAVHGSAELQAQYAAHFVVEHAFGHLALADHIEEGACEIIVVVAEVAFGCQAVGIGAHLHVETVERGLAGVVGASPVSYDHAVETPVALENFVEHQVIVAGVLAADFVVGSH